MKPTSDRSVHERLSDMIDRIDDQLAIEEAHGPGCCSTVPCLEELQSIAAELLIESLPLSEELTAQELAEYAIEELEVAFDENENTTCRLESAAFLINAALAAEGGAS